MFYPVFSSYLLATLAVLILGAVAWGSAPRKDGKRYGSLIFLRWLFLLLFLGVLLRPTLITRQTRTFPGTVLILTDTSRSMTVSEDGETSRYDAMKRAFDDSSPELAAMSHEVDTHVWTFDRERLSATLENGKISFPPTPAGTQTAMGAALWDTYRQMAGQKILGVVLAGDGAQRGLPPRDTLPQTAAVRFGRLGVPLFTVCFGKPAGESRSRDWAVEDFLAEDRGFVDTEMTITGSVRVDGFPNVETTAELVRETRPGVWEKVDAVPVKTPLPSESVPVTFRWTPQEAGEWKLAIRVPVQAGEVSSTNNELGGFVSVREGGISVLYLEGAYRSEMSFLRRAMDAAGDVQMDTVRVEEPGELAKRLKKGYAVILLGDVDASRFDPAELELLGEKVAAGVGLFTLGGFQTYGPGGYAETALAKIFPVAMASQERLPETDPITPDVHWNLPLRMMPTEQGRQSSVLELDRDPAISAKKWAALPPLDGANRFLSVKPGAVILADAAGEKKQRVPLLVGQTVGRGRVLAFAGDSTWKWWLGGFADVHRQFWRQCVLWLAHKDDVVEGNVSLFLPRRRFPQEQEIVFRVEAKLSTGENLLEPTLHSQDADWHAELTRPDGTKTAVPLQRSDRAMLGTLPSGMAVGDYTLSATVFHAGQKVGTSRCRFLIFHEDLELDNAQADPELMASLAAESGGRSVAPEELGKLWTELAQQKDALQMEHEMFTPIWDRWYWMLLLLTLLCTEWWLRKRYNLPD
ncbi:MAG: hypothetical protein Q4D98_01965 [Planctomycetia bacterium]|nr:hypothetical protein [Planctomycetia bacterium]